MPASPRNSRNRSVYLDQSTWSDAYRSMVVADPNAGGVYGELSSWLSNPPEGVDLCFSFTHTVELASWESDRRSMAEWLEGLPLVWVISPEATKVAEVEFWLKKALGSEPPPMSVFVPSMLRALDHLTAEAISEALVAPTLWTLVSAVPQRAIDDMRRTVLGMAERIHRGREAWVASGKSPESGARRAAQDFRGDLRRCAYEVHERLVSTDEGYRNLGADLNDAIEAIERVWANDATALPAYRVEWAFMSELGAAAARRDPAAKKWQSLQGSGFDFQHAQVGGAYCDVFTCDAEAARWISDARVNLGHAPALTRRDFGTDTEFVRAIIDAATA